MRFDRRKIENCALGGTSCCLLKESCMQPTLDVVALGPRSAFLMKKSYRILARAFAAILAAGAVTGVRAAQQNFADLSLEELMNEPITSVSKRPTRLGDAAAAITVITGEEIRRAGVDTLPDAL